MLDVILRALAWIAKVTVKPLFYYPVDMSYVGQDETKSGYVFHVSIRSCSKRVVAVPKDNFSVKIVKDKKLEKRVDRTKILYGEKVRVFDSSDVLQAHLSERSYGSVPDCILCTEQPVLLHLLVSVGGPGSVNPSATFQFSKLYRCVGIRLRKRLFRLTYLEAPIRQIIIVSGNEKTKIVDE
jgi:hypothetical protein